MLTSRGGGGGGGGGGSRRAGGGACTTVYPDGAHAAAASAERRARETQGKRMDTSSGMRWAEQCVVAAEAERRWPQIGRACCIVWHWGQRRCLCYSEV